jgi:hypothetical protein
MKISRLATAVFAAGLMVATSAVAEDESDINSDVPFTLAVFGDWPYNQILLDNAKLLIDSVNSDRDVSLVMHVGDIHSGSQACSSAGILPPIPKSNPGWNQSVYFQFQQFNAPFVYTPGDNEWTDCQKTKEFASGDPLKELASVRSLFFARPGHTLGGNDKEVLTQAKNFDPAYPDDAQFVENVMWEQHRVVFVTLNLPGSNNDTLPWANGFQNQTAQNDEVAKRTTADISWLERAFDKAKDPSVRAVVIGLQADMWDPAQVAPGGDGLDQYTRFVQRLADLSVSFGRPVLLINGDSHLYMSDRPLATPSSATGMIHHTQAVPNLMRITVQGSTNAPAEWLRLTIDPRKNQQPFSWVNVPYCSNPTVACP